MPDDIEKRLVSIEEELRTQRDKVRRLALSLVRTNQAIGTVTEIPMSAIMELSMILGITIRECLAEDQDAIDRLLFKLEDHLDSRERAGMDPDQEKLIRGFLAVLRAEGPRSRR